MFIFAAGLVLLVFLVWLGRGGRVLGRDFRLASALFAGVAALGAVVAGLRGGWPEAVVLIGLSAYLGQAAKGGRVGAQRAVGKGRMTCRQARSILGVGEGVTRAEIEEAYRRLMLRAHPDLGGSTGLAAQINAARDCLLRD
jgi:hypothetical protein